MRVRNVSGNPQKVLAVSQASWYTIETEVPDKNWHNVDILLGILQKGFYIRVITFKTSHKEKKIT